MRATCLAVALCLVAMPAIADPVGRYDAEGANPGSPERYRGTVAVERTGDTYRVIWQVGGTRYVGTGIGNADFIAVSYRAGQNTGLALYSHKGNGIWEGIWTYANGREVGTEKWIPR